MTCLKCPTRILCVLLMVFLAAGCQTFLFPEWFSKPSGSGIYHTVQAGQTLYRIAEVYDVELKILQRANSISNANKIKEGQRLWIPGAYRVRQVLVPTKSLVKKKNKPKEPKPVRGYLIWPVKGVLTSKFGRRKGRNHDGIDIAANLSVQ